MSRVGVTTDITGRLQPHNERACEYTSAVPTMDVARLHRGLPSKVHWSEWWRRRESNPRPKARPRRTLHACPLLGSHARREEAAKNRQAPDPVCLTSARRAATQPPACLMTSGPQPPGEVRADAHSLIRLRERTENPQLTDVPSDLRVNGARHASRDSMPPSKPKSPPQGDRAGGSVPPVL